MIFPPEVEAAIAEFAAERNISRDEAIMVILRDWLTGHNYLPIDSDED